MRNQQVPHLPLPTECAEEAVQPFPLKKRKKKEEVHQSLLTFVKDPF
jgi:hypothetical protein